MIFVTLGTHGQGFPRALELVSGIDTDEPIVVQSGETPTVQAGNLTYEPYMAYERVTALMERADAVICHAGVGTIVTAADAGKQPIVIPRLHELGEHVDDHQVELADELDAMGMVRCYRPGDSLEDLIVETQLSSATRELGGGALAREVRTEVIASCLGQEQRRTARFGALRARRGRRRHRRSDG